MSFLEAIARAKAFLAEHGRVSQNALKREFDLDDEALADFVDELVDVQQVAVRDGAALVAAAAAKRPAAEPVVATEGERRHASVVFSDLSGYTELNERLDPEEVEAFVHRLKALAVEVVEAHGGIVNQFVGDEVLALFGIPAAHGDDPRRAVRAAHELHRRAGELLAGLGSELEGLHLHTGIATGLVLAMARDDRDGRFGVTGDTVNVAARLRSLAPPDEIWIDAATRQYAEQDFDLEALPRTEVKGRSGRVTPYRLGQRRSVAPVRRSAFVGRRRELMLFDAAVQRVLATAAGEILYVRGEPGIGKTRFVEECQQLALTLGLAHHKALVLSFGSGIGGDALRALLWSVLGVTSDDDPDQRRQVVEEVAESMAVSVDGVAALNDLLDVPQTGEARAAYDAMNPATRERRLDEAVAAVVRAAAAERPLLLIVEDLHWAGEATLRRLSSLASAISEVPVLMVMTSRVEGDPVDAHWRQLAGETPVATLDLVGLKPAEALQLANSYFAEGSAPARACVERAEGNPLFLEELLQHSDEALPDGTLPGSVQSVVLARLDRLASLDKTALQAASVLGQRFSLEALRHLLGKADYDCEAPVRQYLVRPEAGELIFSHALIQEGIYESVLRARARQLHLKAAQWFADRDQVLHAQHLDRGGDDRAAAAYLAAAESQVRAYRHDDALQLAARARVVAADAAGRAAASCVEGDIYNELARTREAMAAFEVALTEAQSAAESCRARLGIATSLRTLDRVQEALSVVAVASQEAERAGRLLELTRLHHLEGNLQFHFGRVAECQAAHERALALAQQAGSAEHEARAKAGLADVYWLQARAPLAHRCYRESAALARELGLGRVEVANHVMAGWSLIWVDPTRAAEIREIASVSLAMADRVNDPRTRMLSLLCPVALAAEMLIEVDSVEADRQEALALIEAIGGRRFAPFALNARGRMALRRGELDEAEESHRQALAACRETGYDFLGPGTTANLARVQREPEQARALLAEAERGLASGPGHNKMLVYRDGFYVALQHGDWAEAERFTNLFAGLKGAEEWPWVDACVARCRALIGYGRGERSAELLAELAQHRAETSRNGIWEPGFEMVGAA